MNCGAEILKCLLLVFNFLCLACGIGMTAQGALIVASLHDFDKITDLVAANYVAFTILAVGVAITIISFMGCYGSCSNNVNCLRWYSFIVLCLFICQVGVALYFYMKSDSMPPVWRKAFKASWEQRKSKRFLVDTAEKYFKCCGLDSPQDYINAGEDIPDSCSTSTTGCSKAMFNFAKDNILKIKYGLFTISGILFVCNMFSGYVANRMSRSSGYEDY
ncbi:maker255 [Drosophila busckii]|uniref:Tetraspanin n=1 Tax=Drosophila busckii TaxID=30019 RepID=A0A0M4ESR9_DROBS|nr:23 kDa integral membrane protein [Drosophila busckii]ALC47835.1 maker255 [Drosophila busckii]